MTKEEMRELDSWIAENVFGWHKVETHYDNKSMCSVCGKEFGARHKHYVPEFHNSLTGSVPFYTTNKECALELLDECVDKLAWSEPVTIGETSDGGRFVQSESGSYKAEAATGPLAIALFAKQLFTKATHD